MNSRVSTNEVFKIQLSETRLVELEALMDLSHSVPRIHKNHQVTISPLTIEEEISHLEMTLTSSINEPLSDICAICEEPLNETKDPQGEMAVTEDTTGDTQVNEMAETEDSNEIKDSIWNLNCPHRFHSRCLIQWFKYDPESFSCPLCRQSQKYSGDQVRIFYR